MPTDPVRDDAALSSIRRGMVDYAREQTSPAAERQRAAAALVRATEDARTFRERQRQAAVADFMSQVRTERQIAEFSERVTSTGKHAIPAKPADVAAVLSALPAANREAVQNLLESIYAGGTVDFSEMGTSAGKPIAAEAVQLSSEWQRVLRSHINTGGTVDEFFALNADLLGDKGKYDLGAFAKKEG